MDRFIVKEPRVGADYPQQGNQMIQFTPNAGMNRHIIPETMYFGGYGAELPVQRSPGFMSVTHGNAPHFAPNHSGSNPQMMASGIDPRYLAAYTDISSAYISGQRQQMERHQMPVPANRPAFSNDYQNRTFTGADRNTSNTITAQVTSNSNGQRQQMERDQTPVPANRPAFSNDYQNRTFIGADRNTRNTFTAQVTSNSNDINYSEMMSPRATSTPNIQMKNTPNNHQNYHQQQQKTSTAQTLTKAPAKENDEQKTTIQFPVPLKTRGEKLRDLHKTGVRAFSGPVEKVLKWHKTLQELGLLVLYEVVAKCVSVRNGESCAKTLVVRDDSGPAMQVVYYEIDFLLPDLKPPCTVRVVGRMMPGTCRLQAFSVRQATGDDVSTLPRRAAVAAHHVTKLCKEYGNP